MKIKYLLIILAGIFFNINFVSGAAKTTGKSVAYYLTSAEEYEGYLNAARNKGPKSYFQADLAKQILEDIRLSGKNDILNNIPKRAFLSSLGLFPKANIESVNSVAEKAFEDKIKELMATVNKLLAEAPRVKPPQPTPSQPGPIPPGPVGATKRVFIALQFPPPVEQEFKILAGNLSKVLNNKKFKVLDVPHMTLVFLGERSDAEIETIKTSITQTVNEFWNESIKLTIKPNAELFGNQDAIVFTFTSDNLNNFVKVLVDNLQAKNILTPAVAKGIIDRFVPHINIVAVKNKDPKKPLAEYLDLAEQQSMSFIVPSKALLEAPIIPSFINITESKFIQIPPTIPGGVPGKKPAHANLFSLPL